MHPIVRTITGFWNKKRFLKLLVFALLMGNVTFYCVEQLARKQVLISANQHHVKIYTAFMQAIERTHRSNRGEATPSYTDALYELKKQFPFHRMNVLTQDDARFEKDKRTLEMLKNRPSGWSLITEEDGWASTYYSLPAAAALEVTSYIRDDDKAWQWMAGVIGGYAFFLLLAFGWFWTRALADAEAEAAAAPEFLKAKVAAMDALLAAMRSTLIEIRVSVDELERHHGAAATFEALTEITSHVQLLSINGSVEAARSAESYRVFHVLLEEIHRLSTEAATLLRDARAAPDPGRGEKLSEIRSKLRHLDEILRTDVERQAS